MATKSDDSISLLRAILKDSAAILCVKMAMPLSYFIVTVSVARLLGTADFGILAIVFSYYAIFRILSVFGIDLSLIKEVARDEEKAGFYLGSALITGIFLSVVNMLIMNCVFYLAGYSNDVKTNGLIISLLLLAEPPNRYLESVFIALRKSKYILFSILFAEPVKIACAIAVMLIYKSLIPVAMVLLGGQLFSLLIKLIFFKRLSLKPKLSFNLGIITDIFKASFTMALISGISSFFLAIDVIVLSKIKGELSVGLYSAAYKFITLAFLFADSFGITLLPVLAKAYQDSKALFQELISISLKYFIVFAFAFAIPVFFFSPQLIAVIFGSGFINSSDILRILIFASIFFCGSYLYARMLFSANAQRYDLLSLVVACAVNLLLNIYFTLKWDYIGTAYATTVSAVILFLMHFYFFHKKVCALDIFRLWFKPLIAATLFFASFIYISRAGLYPGFIISGAVYFLTLIVLRVIKKEEISDFVKAILSRE